MQQLRTRACSAFAAALISLLSVVAQPPGTFRDAPGGPAGGGGPGGPDSRELALKQRFDADKDGVLDQTERAQARAFVKENPPARGPGGRGGRGFPGPPPASEPAGTEAPRAPVPVQPSEVETFPQAGLYDQGVIRTIFLSFAQPDWLEECGDFYRTDVEVPATMLVDGKEYRDVGVSCRGNSSYFGVRGKKKSFGIAVDAVHSDQRLYGYKTLNLLNGHADPSFLRETLHAFVGRRFMPVLRANVVRLVVNGESWGAYANVQQFNADFIDQAFGTKQGARWKVPANFRGAGLAYAGDERSAYERSYQLRGGAADADAAWQRLIGLCRTLQATPLDRLEAELPRVLDIDSALRFLALDTVLLDSDGYASRGSDFVMWEGPDERFRLLPYDSNEIMGGGGGMRGGRRGPPDQQPQPQDREAGGNERPARDRGEGGEPPAGPPGPRGGGPMAGASPTSSPLAVADSERPLARLLQVPVWRARYLAFVRAMALEGLDWDTLGPFLASQHQRLDPIVRDDDKALYGYAAFTRSLEGLQRLVATRRKALLEHASLQLQWPTLREVDCKLVERDSEVAVQVVAAATAASVQLWFSPSRSAAFTPVPMLDDGAHGDGAAGDGVFGASTPPMAKKGHAFVYVEAVDADGSAVAFSPSGGSGRPRVVDRKP